MSGVSSETSPPAKVSPFALIAIIITLVVVVMLLFNAVYFYVEKNFEIAMVLLLIGFFGLAACIYMFAEMRRRLLRLRIELPPITTTIECPKCGFKTVRGFQRGDYIFKEVDVCQKCNEKMLITAIYREVHEKKKSSSIF